MLWSLGSNLVLDIGWHCVDTLRIFINLVQNFIVVDSAVHGLVVREKLLICLKFIRDIKQVSSIATNSSGIILLLCVNEHFDQLENAFRFCAFRKGFHSRLHQVESLLQIVETDLRINS